MPSCSWFIVLIESRLARWLAAALSILFMICPPAGPKSRAEEVLTERQLEILKLIARGFASKEIAFQLGLSSKTVDVHRARIMERLNIGDVASLTLYSVRQGLVDPSRPA